MFPVLAAACPSFYRNLRKAQDALDAIFKRIIIWKLKRIPYRSALHPLEVSREQI